MSKLLVDIGNSTVVLALADSSGKIIAHTRFKTSKEGLLPYYSESLVCGLSEMKVDETKAEEITSVVVSSVVPEVNEIMVSALQEQLHVEPHLFGVEDVKRLMQVDVDSPEQVGKDRLADAVAAKCIYGLPAIVFDLGTATTIGVVDEEGRFVGGMILPGVKTSLNALVNRASQLFDVEVDEPEHIIGRNTRECMQSGIVYGTAAQIDGLIERLSSMFDERPNLIATGGMARQIVPYCQHAIIIDELLQLRGLSLI